MGIISPASAPLSWAKDCPMCGGHATPKVWGGGFRRVVCDDCGTQGPERFSDRAAINAWNRRQEPPLPRPLTSKERNRLKVLGKRKAHLDRRRQPNRPGGDFDTEEANALEWAIKLIESAGGRAKLHLPFNVNDRARIKVTERGREVWKRYLEGIGLDPADPDYASSIDADGWMETELWRVAHIFGGACYQGGTPPFETEILLLPEAP